MGKANEICVDENPLEIDSGNCLADNIGTNYYGRSLEKPFVYNPRNPFDNACRIAQPQLHVGILAIPQLSPSVNDENFQLPTVYWEVEYELDVHFDFNSHYTSSNLSLSPDNVIFYNNVGKGYTSGATFCGVDNDWKRSTVSDSFHPVRQHTYSLRRRKESNGNKPSGKNIPKCEPSNLENSTERRRTRKSNIVRPLSIIDDTTANKSDNNNRTNDSDDNSSDNVNELQWLYIHQGHTVDPVTKPNLYRIFANNLIQLQMPC